MHLEDKKVMIPLGIAHLHTSNDEVVLPGLHIDQFNALPEYHKGEISPEKEVQIRSIIGSPAALRIEDSISEFDQNTFYEHHHFDKGRFYKRDGSPIAILPSPAERTEQQETIHKIIEKSHYDAPDPDADNPSSGFDKKN